MKCEARHDTFSNPGKIVFNLIEKIFQDRIQKKIPAENKVCAQRGYKSMICLKVFYYSGYSLSSSNTGRHHSIFFIQALHVI